MAFRFFFKVRSIEYPEMPTKLCEKGYMDIVIHSQTVFDSLLLNKSKRSLAYYKNFHSNKKASSDCFTLKTLPMQDDQNNFLAFAFITVLYC